MCTPVDCALEGQRGTGDRKTRTCANTGEEILGSGAFKWFGQMIISLVMCPKMLYIYIRTLG